MVGTSQPCKAATKAVFPKPAAGTFLQAILTHRLSERRQEHLNHRVPAVGRNVTCANSSVCLQSAFLSMDLFVTSSVLHQLCALMWLAALVCNVSWSWTLRDCVLKAASSFAFVNFQRAAITTLLMRADKNQRKYAPDSTATLSC